MDISEVNGIPVTSTNAAARDLAEWLGQLSDNLTPAEVGSPWPGLQPATIHFADAAHDDHLHVGWESYSL